MFHRPTDARFRAAAFEWLRGLTSELGDVLPYGRLRTGFELDGGRVRVLGPQGIFKPAAMTVPLSIKTIPSGPYDDGFRGDGILDYRYRGKDASHRDNVGLRFAMAERLPLIYFHGVVKGRYLTTWPVYVVGDRPEVHTFEVQVDDAQHIALEPAAALAVSDDAADARRRYVTATVRVRLHQRAFRERVLDAYLRECAFCRFRHEELLEAAHITADADPLGEPVVSNGLSLCRLHHGAFDRHFLAVRPDDLRIEVRADLLDEEDGPTLLHGIQGLHGQRIHLPRRGADRPDEQRLIERYGRFLEQGRRGSS